MEQTGDLVVRVAAVVAAYALGSIPFSYLVARRSGVDVRTVGSGNVGATNVMRSVGRGAGLLAFALDFLKGLAASLLGRWIEPQSPLPALCAVMAVLGHMYPLWLRFRGGKGVATGAGVIAVLVPLVTVLVLAAWAVVLAATRFMSLASLTAAVLLFVLRLLLTDDPWGREHLVITLFCAVGSALVIVRHQGNIRRLIAGTEHRL